MTRKTADEWASFLLLLDGGASSFLFGDVFSPSPRGNVIGSPYVDGANQTGKILNVAGLQPNTQNAFRKNDKIQVGLNLHAVLKDADTNGDGKASLELFPRLRVIHDNQTPIITENARGLFHLSAGGGGLYSSSLSSARNVTSLNVLEVF